MIKYVVALCLLVDASASLAAPKQLFKEVNPNKALRLEEYNSAFLQEALYQSARHRIVKVDIKMLEKDKEFLFQAFSDTEAVLFHGEAQQLSSNPADEEWWRWSGKPSAFDVLPDVDLYIHNYDIDKETGVANPSAENKFKHSRHWTFDEGGVLVLETLTEGEFAIAGPPPETPEDIEYHKKLKKLRKNAFRSTSSTQFYIPTKNGLRHYYLIPLKYTPKYSVIYEKDPEKHFAIIIDLAPGETDNRSELHKLREREYLRFVAGLEKKDKAIKEEAE